MPSFKSPFIRFSAVAAVTVALAAPFAVTPTAVADGHGEDVIAARKAMMQYVGGTMKALGGMARGSADFNADVVSARGEALAAIAMAFPHMYPEGSETGGKTSASAAAFTDNAGLAKQSMVLADAANTLAAASNLDELRAAMGGVGGTCRACHTAYRQ